MAQKSIFTCFGVVRAIEAHSIELQRDGESRQGMFLSHSDPELAEPLDDWEALR